MGVNEIIQIGNRIRKERIARGYTQKELAMLAGISYSTYSNYENNNREPGRDALLKIAAALDVPVDSFWVTSSEEVTLDDADTLVTLAGYNLIKIDDEKFLIYDHEGTNEAVASAEDLKELTKQTSDYIAFLLHKWFEREKNNKFESPTPGQQ